MENLLRQYLDTRMGKESIPIKPGGVITISREYGCPSKILADMLVQRINAECKHKSGDPSAWKWIGKELLEEAAALLRVQPSDISHVYNYRERSLVEDLLAATRKNGSYRTDRAIRSSIAKVIRSFAENGRVVIVGRAGMAITRQMPGSLHVRLMAPLEWRISRISEVYSLKRGEAIQTIASKDENRRKFLEYYLGHEFRIHDFDAVFNCSTCSLEEIADSVILLIRKRSII